MEKQLRLPIPLPQMIKQVQNSHQRIILSILGMLLSTMSIQAQQWTAGDNVTLHVPEYALIETNYAPVALSLTTSTAGAAVASATNSDLFVKISSITPGGTHRQLTARISNGTVPQATILSLISASCTTTNSGGELGVPSATPIVLSNIDQPLVSLIGSCYTGTGNNDGYQMTFNWQVDNPSTNYGLIQSATDNITVVFTISAHDGNN